jgi:uncharacterized protein VirK/YbjX
LANSRQADLQGAKVIQSLKKISSEEIEFFGYGGKNMAAEGFRQDFVFDIDNLLDKTFHSFRKSKTNTKANHWKWNPFNLVNKHMTRNADQVYDLFTEANVPKRIYQARPNLVLNIGNEYLAMNLMEDLASKSFLNILTFLFL